MLLNDISTCAQGVPGHVGKGSSGPHCSGLQTEKAVPGPLGREDALIRSGASLNQPVKCTDLSFEYRCLCLILNPTNSGVVIKSRGWPVSNLLR